MLFSTAQNWSIWAILRVRATPLRSAFLAGLFTWAGWLSSDLDGGLIADEAVYMRSGLSMVWGNLYQNPTHMHAPLVKYVLGVAQMFLGVTPTVGRLVGVAFGVGTIIGVWYLGREVATERAGLVAAALTAFTYEFVVIIPTALLEPGMLFCFTVALAALVKWEYEDLDPAYLGVALLVLGATKVRAGILVIAILAVFAAARPSLREVIRLGVGVAGAGIVVYLPYMLVGPPNYYGGEGVPAVAKTLFRMPIAAGPAYIWAATVVHNLGHVSSGHTVTFLGQTVDRAPFWAYPIWMVTRAGVVHLLGLGAAGYLVATERSRLSRVAAVVVVVFVVLTLIPVRLPRYTVVLYPVTAVVAAGFAEREFDASYAHIALVILLLPAVLSVPMSPAPDSGYDQAATYVEANAPDGAHVVTENPAALTWHLGFTTVENYNYNITRAHVYSISSNRSVTISKYGDGCVVIGTMSDHMRHVRRFVSRKYHVSGHPDHRWLYVVRDECEHTTA